jgi:hypothetical protein
MALTAIAGTLIGKSNGARSMRIAPFPAVVTTAGTTIESGATSTRKSSAPSSRSFSRPKTTWLLEDQINPEKNKEQTADKCRIS